MRTSTTNPQAAAVNQKRGPTVGNENPGGKRKEFLAAKSKSGSERSALADMVTGAVAARGRGMRGYRDSAVEGIKMDVNVGRKGSNRGNKA